MYPCRRVNVGRSVLVESGRDEPDGISMKPAYDVAILGSEIQAWGYALNLNW